MQTKAAILLCLLFDLVGSCVPEVTEIVSKNIVVATCWFVERQFCLRACSLSEQRPFSGVLRQGKGLGTLSVF